MDKEQLPVLLVLEPAKDHSQARYSVTVKNAMELDGVVARSAAVLAKSNQQIQNSSFSVMGLVGDARTIKVAWSGQITVSTVRASRRAMAILVQTSGLLASPAKAKCVRRAVETTK